MSVQCFPYVNVMRLSIVIIAAFDRRVGSNQRNIREIEVRQRNISYHRWVLGRFDKYKGQTNRGELKVEEKPKR